MSEHQTHPNKLRKSRKASWPRIHTGKLPSGQAVWTIDVRVNGERTFRRFTTAADAEELADKLRAQRKAEGHAAFELPSDNRAEAKLCLDRLAKYPGASLTAAVDYYIDRVLTVQAAPTIADGVALLLDERVKTGLRKRTVDNLRHRWGRFVKEYGTRKFAEITADDVTQWMFRQSEHPETQHNYRRKVNELFRAAMRKKWCKENPVQDAAKPNRIAPTPEVFTVDELVRVLEHADEYGLMPYIVLGTFCGIRVSELEQLDWSKVSLTDRAVTIEATTAKTKTRRVITLNDTAVAWLTPHVKKSGPVVEVEGLRERLLQLREAAKLTKWPHNAMRHSFGSYAVRQWNDLPKVSYEMGNSVQVCRRHYEQVVTKSEAERFWSLRPSEAKNIIPMPKVANA